MPRKGFAHLAFVALLGAVIVVSAIAGVYLSKQQQLPGGIVCTQEAKQCPDGSYVGRTGPNCEFAECPVSPVLSIPTQPEYKSTTPPDEQRVIDLKIMRNALELYYHGCGTYPGRKPRKASSECDSVDNPYDLVGVFGITFIPKDTLGMDYRYFVSADGESYTLSDSRGELKENRPALDPTYSLP